MEIGEPLREFIIEPLELPEPLREQPEHEPAVQPEPNREKEPANV